MRGGVRGVVRGEVGGGCAQGVGGTAADNGVIFFFIEE